MARKTMPEGVNSDYYAKRYRNGSGFIIMLNKKSEKICNFNMLLTKVPDIKMADEFVRYVNTLPSDYFDSNEKRKIERLKEKLINMRGFPKGNIYQRTKDTSYQRMLKVKETRSIFNNPISYLDDYYDKLHSKGGDKNE